MSTNPDLQLSLTRSSDLTHQIDGLSTVLSRTYRPAFNKPGTFDISVPIMSDAARLIRKRATALVAVRNGRTVWSGACTRISHSGSSGTTSATFTGWLEEANQRYIRKDEEQDLIFTGVAGGNIVGLLVAEMNAQQDTDGGVQPTHLGFRIAFDTQLRTRAYKVGASYGASISELVEVEDGIDIYVDPVTRLITTKDPAAYVDRKGVRFGYYAEPYNLSDLQIDDDGTTLFNRVNVTLSNGLVVPADDQQAIQSAGIMLEQWLSLSDISNPTTGAEYANGELVYSRYGTTTYTITPEQYGDMPRLHDDFELGDKVYLSADYGALQVADQAVRIFSAQVDYDQQGNEILSSIGLAP